MSPKANWWEFLKNPEKGKFTVIPAHAGIQGLYKFRFFVPYPLKKMGKKRRNMPISSALDSGMRRNDDLKQYRSSSKEK